MIALMGLRSGRHGRFWWLKIDWQLQIMFRFCVSSFAAQFCNTLQLPTFD